MSRKEKHNVDLSLVPTIRTITKTLPTLAAIEAQFKNSNSSNKVLFTNIRQDVSFLGREIGQLLLKPSFDTLYELLEKGIEEQVEKSAERILQTITVDHWSEMKQHLTAEKAAILSGFKAEGYTKASSERTESITECYGYHVQNQQSVTGRSVEPAWRGYDNQRFQCKI
jgi:hypothetical protein